MINVMLNKESVNNASEKFFSNDKDFFSFFVSEVNGVSFDKRYKREYTREKNGNTEVYSKTIIPKTEKTAMLFKIKQYIEFEKDNKYYQVIRVLSHAA